MKAVDPAVPRTATWHTLTQRVMFLRPQGVDLIDAAFLALLCMVSLLGFRTTFDSYRFLAVGAVAVVLGIVFAYVVSALSWPWIVSLVIAILAYFVLGGAVALPGEALKGFAPSTQVLGDLARLPVFGWKSLLTTLPPVAGDSQFLVLVWLLGLIFAVIGFGVARGTWSPQLVLIAPLVLFAGVILLGGPTPSALLPQGLGFAALAVGWALVRTDRRRRLIGTGAPRASQILLGVVLAVAALAAGAFLGPVLPGTNGVDRVVLRTYVQPPIDVSDYPSPLPGFAKYASKALEQDYDTELFATTGLSSGTQVRIAVLDQYTGFGWSASGTSAMGSGFRRVGSVLPTSVSGKPVTMTVTVSDAYAAAPELNPWIPALGPSTSVAFEGPNASGHLDNLGYDPDKGQAIVADLLAGGDTVRLTSIPVPWLSDQTADVSPAGMIMVPTSASDFAATQIATLAGDGATPWAQLMNVGEAFTKGFWSDGSQPGQGQYLPGDGQARLASFFSGQQLVGSDEQYAAAFALAANRLGFPARVVFGAKVEDGGKVLGQDVEAWVEVDTTNGWEAVPTTWYIPDRSHTPQDLPPDQQTSDKAQVVPPPRPAEPPSSLDDMAAQANASRGQSNSRNQEAGQAAWVRPTMYAGSGVGGLVLIVLLLLGAKALRQHRRRTRGGPVAQIEGGWLELLDCSRDIGKKNVDRSLTRREQAKGLGLSPLVGMAGEADQAMFGPDAPDAGIVAAYWADVHAAKKALLQGRGALRRFAARINPRSLLPNGTGAAVVATTSRSAPKAKPAAKNGKDKGKDKPKRSDKPARGHKMAKAPTVSEAPARAVDAPSGEETVRRAKPRRADGN